MTDTELVGILRISDRPVTLYAAQRIEALTAECERLKAQNEWYVETQREQTQRATAAEAELIRLKAGLIGRLAEGEGT